MKDYNEIYRYAWNAQEIRRAEKLIAAAEAGRINRENYWDFVRGLCANVRSDHALGRWQIIAENFYNLYINQEA